MKKTVALLTLVCLMLSLALSGCGGTPDSTPEASVAPSEATSEVASEAKAHVDDPAAVTMLVAAASSLETAYTTDLIPMFEELYPWITVEGTYDSSGKLQTQIEEGLEADVFMSAANTQMNNLVAQDLIDAGTVVELLENEIVLIAPIDSDTEIASFAGIAEADTIALGDPESVPAGQYAEEVLTSLGVYDAAAAKASFGTNVTEVLNWVAEGSADVGIVYATDAAQMPDKVRVIATAPEGSLAKKVIYPVGITAEAQQREAAALFVEFLQSPEATAVFIEAGFKSNL